MAEECKHELVYCRHCGVVTCGLCGREWISPEVQSGDASKSTVIAYDYRVPKDAYNSWQVPPFDIKV